MDAVARVAVDVSLLYLKLWLGAVLLMGSVGLVVYLAQCGRGIGPRPKRRTP